MVFSSSSCQLAVFELVGLHAHCSQQVSDIPHFYDVFLLLCNPYPTNPPVMLHSDSKHMIMPDSPGSRRSDKMICHVEYVNCRNSTPKDKWQVDVLRRHRQKSHNGVLGLKMLHPPSTMYAIIHPSWVWSSPKKDTSMISR
ncbi:hypothetical protein T265_08735 [Opisthorchis viverrini]|uniref:Uncharacterized protein n=1 Tax=Opisthorchis viverrini TaxID=6198 RepID=A0A074ZJ36_OPIVI|nr:hypothetical protein T265_08735 [Opisthorchis viverrini]KER23360.1 hypothetical protein T265_08735 [Opisthorchis viverrini]